MPERPNIPEAVRARMTVSYDAGMFDKDAGGWCSRVHDLSFDGDTYVVRVQGDDNGQYVFEQTSTLEVLDIDHETDIVSLSREHIFDLRTQRLLSGVMAIEERLTLASAPSDGDVEAFAGPCVAVLDALGGREPRSPCIAWDGTTLDRGNVRRATVSSASEGALLGVLFATQRESALLGLELRPEVLPNPTFRWSWSSPLVVEVRGYVHVRLAPALRRAVARGVALASPPG